MAVLYIKKSGLWQVNKNRLVVLNVHESYFISRHVKGKFGRGAGKKIPVPGITKRGDKLFTKVISDCSREELLLIIKGKVLDGSDVYIDG